MNEYFVKSTEIMTADGAFESVGYRPAVFEKKGGIDFIQCSALCQVLNMAHGNTEIFDTPEDAMARYHGATEWRKVPAPHAKWADVVRK